LAEIRDRVENDLYYMGMGDYQIITLNYLIVLRELISSAQDDLDFTSYVFSFFFYRKLHPSSKVFAAIKAAAERGVQIRCLLDSSKKNRPNHKANWFAFKRLAEIGVDVKMPSAPLPQHSKVFIAGPDKVLTGSHNISDSSLRNPFEISVLFDSVSVYKKVKGWYDDIWNYYSSPWRRR